MRSILLASLLALAGCAGGLPAITYSLDVDAPLRLRTWTDDEHGLVLAGHVQGALELHGWATHTGFPLTDVSVQEATWFAARSRGPGGDPELVTAESWDGLPEWAKGGGVELRAVPGSGEEPSARLGSGLPLPPFSLLDGGPCDSNPFQDCTPPPGACPPGECWSIDAACYQACAAQYVENCEFGKAYVSRVCQEWKDCVDTAEQNYQDCVAAGNPEPECDVQRKAHQAACDQVRDAWLANVDEAYAEMQRQFQDCVALCCYWNCGPSLSLSLRAAWE